MKTCKVCIGSACHLKGSYEIINILKKAIERDGNSDKVGAVATTYDDKMYSLQPATAEEFYNTVIKESI